MLSFISTGGNLLGRLLGLSANGLSARCSCSRLWLTPAVKSFSTAADDPPRLPPTGYIRFIKQQQPVLFKQYPGVKTLEITKKIALQWQALSAEQKQPFEQAAKAAREEYKVELSKFYARLTPAQSMALSEKKRQKLARRKSIRKKRELTMLGKPKRPRTAFNIYMSEHFVEARGATMQTKMKSLMEDWRNLQDSQKKVYEQLAEDDKVRYRNEIKPWEKYMEEIGREDLLRRKSVTADNTVGAKGLKGEAKAQTGSTGLNLAKTARRVKKPQD
ncbi:hypothetical protein AAFF_G00136020 [Aldrovandia affinis]|uniref:Transcription factor A, mitochondrial n=1 Tax=Aldrovandia affinis TaxID=143900 RepID=A0AAD7RPV6_9TELE|nr:hypothetical protein AAFF_G00136020 [Aldrovandia affinis]